eukprot:gene22220-29284_t
MDSVIMGSDYFESEKKFPRPISADYPPIALDWVAQLVEGALDNSGALLAALSQGLPASRPRPPAPRPPLVRPEWSSTQEWTLKSREALCSKVCSIGYQAAPQPGIGIFFLSSYRTPSFVDTFVNIQTTERFPQMIELSI